MLRRQPVGSGNRRAALLSAVIAVPIAVVVFFVAYNVLASGAASSASPGPGTSAAASPGSTAPVAVPVATLSAAHAQMCLAFIAQLGGENGKLHGLDERHVTAGPEQNAAFGDPPITVQCGAPAPKVASTDQVYTLTGVCWSESTVTGATVWTTLDREVPVAVTIPDHYDPPGQWANIFSAPLVSAMPSVATPYNC